MRLAIILCIALALCVADARVLHTRRGVPKGWAKKAHAPSTHPITFIVALNQRNLDVLESEFWAISDPTSPRYQEFKTINEVLNIVAPPKEEQEAVVEWLTAHGASNIKNFGDAIEATATVAQCEALFNTKFYTYHHTSGQKIIRQWGAYSVPPAVEHLVHMVSGLSEFPIPHYRTIRSPVPVDAPLDGTPSVVPQTVQTVYGTPTSVSIYNSSQGVIEWEEQYFAPADLASFAQQMNLKIDALSSNHIIGTNDPSAPGDEAELDIQYVAGVGLNVQNWFWSESGTTWLYGFATHFFSTANVPLVISVSYGWSEADQCEEGIGAEECQQLGVDSHGYAARVNAEFQKIGLRGVSIFVASGDSGANGRTDEDCTEPYLIPDFPAASPFVTSVGATEVHNPKTSLANQPPACQNQGYACISGGVEAAVSFDQSNFASGGGFSNVGARPSYQDSAVQAYFQSGVALPPASYYNATGRGYPDVAAFGSNVLIYDGGLTPVGGTSCSSPIWAGVAALLNNIAIKNTGKPLGFMNPLLYAIHASDPSAFTDVTVGDNKCTEGGCASSCQGYLCAKGWDPVTGLGTPVYAKLATHVDKITSQRN